MKLSSVIVDKLRTKSMGLPQLFSRLVSLSLPLLQILSTAAAAALRCNNKSIMENLNQKIDGRTIYGKKSYKVAAKGY